MKVANVCLVGLVFVVCAWAEPLLEGRVRLESGEPVADAQVRLFDLTDLRQGAVARAQTDGTGYFALPLAALRGRALPEGFALGPNYPNPFNPSTIIPYQLPTATHMRLEVFNLLGQRIATLVDGERPAGFHTATWHAADAAGRAVGAGVYIYRLTGDGVSVSRRMVLLDGQAGLPAAGAAGSPPTRAAVAPDGEYGLVVSGQGIAPTMVRDLRVEAGMAPVDVVVSVGQQLAALNDDEEGPSPRGKAQVSLAAPAAPTNLRVEAVTDSSGLVRWDAVEGATDYDVNYKPAVGGQWTNVPHKGTRLYTTIYDLAPNTEYRWAVRAENRDGPSEWAFGPNFTTVGADGQVSIPDANLRAAIEDTLGKASGAPITVAEMETLTGLRATNAGISDLTGLEFATNLTELPLYRNNISDISALAGLTNLTSLDLGGNNISDISALAGLTNLTELPLYRNNISDISALAGLTNLTSLDLYENNISDISALAGLTNLTSLDLSGNNISDISALAGLTNLTWLHLCGNNISDISALAGLTNLLWLPLCGNNISDISALAGLTNLFTLYLGNNNISDISALAGLTNLKNLWLDLNHITDISPLAGLTELIDLDLTGNALNSFSINDRIAALKRNGTTVLFDPPLRESDFDIELVFVDDFAQQQKRVIQYAARLWMSIIREDLPDYTFTQDRTFQFVSDQYNILSGERIDDLRIYVHSYNGGPTGKAGQIVLRETYLSVVGFIGFSLDFNYISLDTAVHEIGHVLGIGTILNYSGFLQDLNGDTHFNGPLAIAAFNDAGGRTYTGEKVPMERDGSHWRSSVLGDEIMTSAGSTLSAITVQALADLGYSVDVTQAHPYTLPSAAAKASAKVAVPSTHAQPEFSCGVGEQREPIYVVDPQGRIIGTLGE